MNTGELKAAVIAEWADKCAKKITTTETIELTGAFKDYVEGFNFGIFTFKRTLELIDEHRNTPYFAARFGGGLPDRPAGDAPPATLQSIESRYVRQLYDVYNEECAAEVSKTADLDPYPELSRHLERQREYFYAAESLRNFARDTVPPGTFEDLQTEIYSGVIEIEQEEHSSSMKRLTAVTQAAVQLQISQNGLISVTRVSDKRGICHQLANEDRLSWRKT